MTELVCTAMVSPFCNKSRWANDFVMVKGSDGFSRAVPVLKWWDSGGRLCTPCRQYQMDGRVQRNPHATSVAAAQSQKQTADTVRDHVLRLIIDAGEDGMTDHELAQHFPESNRVRTRRQELIEKFHRPIFDSGRTRPTDTGHQAIVWVYRP